jgi:hypothetical protein
MQINQTPATRRQFSKLLAAMAGAGAAAVVPVAAFATVTKDPILQAIAEHKDAELAVCAAKREIDRLDKVAEAAGLPCEIQMLDFRQRPFCPFVTARSVSDISRLAAGDHEQRQFHFERLMECERERIAFWGFDPDETLLDPANDREWHARVKFAETVPTTPEGFRAKIARAVELGSKLDVLHAELLASLATAAEALNG